MLHTSLVRRVHFSSGHRYAVADWPKEKNESVFGSCYSPDGHGHNYILDASITGPIDVKSGMILNLRAIDKILKQVISPLDHHFLNTDVPEFKTKVPTTENLALFCFDKISELLPSNTKLEQVRLYESEDLWVDIKASN